MPGIVVVILLVLFQRSNKSVDQSLALQRAGSLSGMGLVDEHHRQVHVVLLMAQEGGGLIGNYGPGFLLAECDTQGDFSRLVLTP